MAEMKQDMTARLADLGTRIERKRQELETQGVLHGEARQRAVDLQIEHTRIVKLARGRAQQSPDAERDATVAAEVEALRSSFERWIAVIDSGYRAR